MKKLWEYGVAEYDGTRVDAHISLAGVGSTQDLLPLLNEAGAQGWELCATVPAPSIRSGALTNPEKLGLIFKRRVEGGDFE